MVSRYQPKPKCHIFTVIISIDCKYYPGNGKYCNGLTPENWEIQYYTSRLLLLKACKSRKRLQMWELTVTVSVCPADRWLVGRSTGSIHTVALGATDNWPTPIGFCFVATAATLHHPLTHLLDLGQSSAVKTRLIADLTHLKLNGARFGFFVWLMAGKQRGWDKFILRPRCRREREGRRNKRQRRSEGRGRDECC